MSDLAKTISRNISMVRKEMSFSLQDVADGVGASKSAIHYIESGRNNITIRMLEKIATFFGLPVSALISDTLTYGRQRGENDGTE